MSLHDLHLALGLFLLANLAAGLVRILIGPSAADRMLAAQLFGTTGVAALLLFAEAQGLSALRDVALAVALLSFVAAVAFVRRLRIRAARGNGNDDA